MLSLWSNEVARRGTWTCFSCSALALGPQGLLTAPKHRRPAQIHQRKHSSSKPSSTTKQDSRAIATPAEPPSDDSKCASLPDGEKTSSSRSRKRRLKENLQEAVSKSSDTAHLNLPSVPSTERIHPLDIHLASFFSQHRPISVSHVIPSATSTEAFSSLFDQPKPTKSKHEDVIYTLSSAVDTLDRAVAQHGDQRAPEDIDLAAVISQASSSTAQPAPSTHLDASPKPHQISLQDLAKNFRPFVPPPPPVPFAALKEAARKTAKEQERQVKTTAWSSKHTVYVNVHPDGQNTYRTFTTSLVRVPVSPESQSEQNLEMIEMPVLPQERQSFLRRMLERQITHEDRQDQKFGLRIPTMHTLSTRRQRKLKMKKHKYKKLLKRTRNLRKRLGQA